MENLAVEAQMQMVRSNFCFKLKYVAEWGQSGMQSLQTTFHSSFFVFKRGMQTSKTFSLLYIQDWIRNVCKGIFQKKERDLNSFAVTFQVTVIAFKKNLLNLRFWCMDECNSVAKSFLTVSKSLSRNSFSSLQIQGFQNLSAPFFNFWDHSYK